MAVAPAPAGPPLWGQAHKHAAVRLRFLCRWPTASSNELQTKKLKQWLANCSSSSCSTDDHRQQQICMRMHWASERWAIESSNARTKSQFVRLLARSLVRSLSRSLVSSCGQSAIRSFAHSVVQRWAAPHLEVFDRKVGHDNGGVRWTELPVSQPLLTSSYYVDVVVDVAVFGAFWLRSLPACVVAIVCVLSLTFSVASKKEMK